MSAAKFCRICGSGTFRVRSAIQLVLQRRRGRSTGRRRRPNRRQRQRRPRSRSDRPNRCGAPPRTRGAEEDANHQRSNHRGPSQTLCGDSPCKRRARTGQCHRARRALRTGRCRRAPGEQPVDGGEGSTKSPRHPLNDHAQATERGAASKRSRCLGPYST